MKQPNTSRCYWSSQLLSEMVSLAWAWDWENNEGVGWVALYSSSKGSLQFEIWGPGFPSLELTNPPNPQVR